MSLASFIRPELIFPDLSGTDRDGILRALAERIAGEGAVESADALYRRLREREELGSTGIGSGVAIPHCKLNGLDRVLVAVGLTRRGVEFGAADDKPVRVFFTVVSPEKDPAAHLHSLAAISKWVKADQHVTRISKIRDRGEIYEFLQRESP